MLKSLLFLAFFLVLFLEVLINNRLSASSIMLEKGNSFKTLIFLHIIRKIINSVYWNHFGKW